MSSGPRHVRYLVARVMVLALALALSLSLSLPPEPGVQRVVEVALGHAFLVQLETTPTNVAIAIAIVATPDSNSTVGAVEFRNVSHPLGDPVLVGNGNRVRVLELAGSQGQPLEVDGGGGFFFVFQEVLAGVGGGREHGLAHKVGEEVVVVAVGVFVFAFVSFGGVAVGVGVTVASIQQQQQSNDNDNDGPGFHL
eukprot:CAMPEP_0168311902 /NCGR_PEP_ID=MMETSP0142_2-20121227/67611_1 /TAXON_ID=44445 /ORGANISM="Pseudo-nitzschia australis, Strain 10249 10 AB" /LENGTH=194 /DNA_ID=CAMNT_0008264825 /DNA_START=169 /DNA_END=752 /DNA_ORIENTATION=+